MVVSWPLLQGYCLDAAIRNDGMLELIRFQALSAAGLSLLQAYCGFS
jgi:hypothetical protein